LLNKVTKLKHMKNTKNTMPDELFNKLLGLLKLDYDNSDIYNVGMDAEWGDYEINMSINETDNYQLFVQVFGDSKIQYEPTSSQLKTLNNKILKELKFLESENEDAEKQAQQDIEDYNTFGESGALYSTHY